MTSVLMRLAIVVGVGVLSAGAAFKLARPNQTEDRRRDALALLLAALGLALVLLQYADPRFDLDRRVPLPGGLWRDLLLAPGALLVGVALARARGGARQRVLTALLTIGYAFFAIHDPAFVLLTLGENRGPPKVAGEVVLQRNDRNCLPASAATVLRRWGLDASDGALAIRMHTSYYGTLEHRALDALAKAGAPAGLTPVLVRTSWDELKAIDHPCVLLVRLVDQTPHAVAFLGFAGDRVVIGEPLQGRQTFEPAVFEAWKRWEGDAIVLGRDVRHDLGRGQRAPVIARARAALARVDGVSASVAAGADLFDDDLERRLRTFQRARGLPETGRLEPRTLLALWAVLDAGKIPSLRSPER